MSRKFYTTALLLMILCVSSYSDSKINPYLADVLAGSSDNERVRIYITFNDPLTLNDFADIPYDAPKSVRRQTVIDRLISHANNSQSRVKSFLASRSGDAEILDVMWMVNSLVINANRNAVYTLDAAGYSEISQINLDPQWPVDQMLDDITMAMPFKTALAPESGIILMNADDCWALGNRGDSRLTPMHSPNPVER